MKATRQRGKAMRKQTPPPTQPTAPRLSIERPATEFTAPEMRDVLKGMVVAELEAGFLRYSRRQALLDYSQKLGIPEFEACLLIADAQYHAGDIEPIQFDTATRFETVRRPEARSIPLKLALVLAAAILADLLLINWLFG